MNQAYRDGWERIFGSKLTHERVEGLLRRSTPSANELQKTESCFRLVERFASFR